MQVFYSHFAKKKSFIPNKYIWTNSNSTAVHINDQYKISFLQNCIYR